MRVLQRDGAQSVEMGERKEGEGGMRGEAMHGCRFHHGHVLMGQMVLQLRDHTSSSLPARPAMAALPRRLASSSSLYIRSEMSFLGESSSSMYSCPRQRQDVASMYSQERGRCTSNALMQGTAKSEGSSCGCTYVEHDDGRVGLSRRL